MIVVAVVFVSLALMFILFKKLEDKIRSLIGWQRHSEKRIGGLEIKDYAQDLRLDSQQKRINHLRSEVDELGRDVGWTDDNRSTQVLKTPKDDDGTS